MQVHLLLNSTIAAVQGYMTTHSGHGLNLSTLENYLFQLNGHGRVVAKVLVQLDGLFHVVRDIGSPPVHVYG